MGKFKDVASGLIMFLTGIAYLMAIFPWLESFPTTFGIASDSFVSIGISVANYAFALIMLIGGPLMAIIGYGSEE